jgi:outer membrane protein OmpA-like peptidoglycan-associated protein
MKKIYLFVLISLLMSTGAWGGDLYSTAYFEESGVPRPLVDTEIDSLVDAAKLKDLRVDRHALLYFNQNRLTDDSLSALDEIISAAKNRTDAYIAIIGHTSSFTRARESLPLGGWASLWYSLQYGTPDRQPLADEVNSRIRIVYDTLADQGIDPGRIFTENRMDRDPLYTEATSSGKRLNRRVFVGLLGRAD